MSKMSSRLDYMVRMSVQEEKSRQGCEHCLKVYHETNSHFIVVLNGSFPPLFSRDLTR